MNNRLEPLNQRHAFISYVHEDKVEVDGLQEALEAAGISVWRDSKNLWPGQNWEDKIRAAIKSESLAFIACFSTNSAAREKSYQYAELALAADEYRLRPPDTEWMIPVRFSECVIPEFNLGAGRSLNSLHRTDLFGSDKVVQTIRLVQAVQQIVNPVAPVSAVVAGGIAAVRQAESPRQIQAQQIKQLLRDPNGDIALEDLAVGMANVIRDALIDEQTFPTSSPKLDEHLEAAEFVVQQVEAYERTLEPAFELIMLGAMYGLPRHEQIWTRMVQILGSTAQVRNGQTALLNLREYPLVLVQYIASIAALVRANYGALRAFIADPEIRVGNGKVPIVLHTGPRKVVRDIEWIASALCLSEENGSPVDTSLVDGLRNRSIGGRHTPVSDHLFHLLRPLFDSYFADENDYAETFDEAEIMMDLISSDSATLLNGKYWGGRQGYGRYTWRHVHDENPPEKQAQTRFMETESGWSPLLSGIFGGSLDRATTAFEEIVEGASTIRRAQW